MKSQIVNIIILSLLFSFTSNTVKAQMDPALAGAVITGDALVNGTLVNIKEKQLTIATLQASIATQVGVIREYERKMYNYLCNAQGAIQNMYEIVQAGELTVEISKNLKECIELAGEHPDGAAMTAAMSNTSIKIGETILGLYTYIATLVLRGDNNSTESGVNLLNSAERNAIMTKILYDLRRTNNLVLTLKYQIEYTTLAHLPEKLFPLDYYYLTSSRDIANNIIGEFRRR